MGSPQGERYALLKGKLFPVLKMGSTITLHNVTLCVLKTAAESEKINDLSEVHALSITTSIIHSLSLIHIAAFCAKYEKWIDKIQTLERLINENRKNAQTETEQFRQEPTVPLHDESEECSSRLSENQT